MPGHDRTNTLRKLPDRVRKMRTNADLENIQYRKLLLSCEYYNYYHFEHLFRENVEFGATKNSRDSRGHIIQEYEIKKILETCKKVEEKVA